MNRLKRISSLVLAVLMFVTLNSFSLMAYAAEQGTESNPYQITTAQELQNINDNVSAHYKLMADIDLKNMDFIPIGNADSGAFSGSFDGNGHTISNLNVFSGKYAGLFGCNEGIIKNVTLKDIYVYGTRYLGGVAAQNTSSGTIADCKVLSGNIESDGGLNDINAGGICGINSGNFAGEFSNGSDIYIKTNKNIILYTGGIVGFSNSASISFTASSNYGSIYSFSRNFRDYTGGIIGFAESNLFMSQCNNSGCIKTGAGLVGKINKNATITNCYNSGNFGWSFYDIVGNWYVYAHYYAGGIVGTCYNERGKGYTTIITNCYNSGSVINDVELFGTSDGYTKKESSGIYGCNDDYCGNVVLKYCFSQNNKFSYNGNNGVLLNEKKMQIMDSFETFDFDNIWDTKSDYNSGYPILRINNGEFTLSKSYKSLLAGSTLQLIAYKNGIEDNNIKWLTTYGTATVDSKGNVTASGKGLSTVTAIDSEGNRANCNIYVMSQNDSVSLNDFTVQQGKVLTQTITLGNSSSGDFIVDAKSSNSDVVEVTGFGGTVIAFLSKSAGSATISFETAQGYKGTCIATVTNTAESISLPSSITLGRGATRQLTATTNPSPTSSKITWTSSDNNVATVDQSGNVTGLNTGTTVITARTDNGYSATCNVTVNAPITSMEFENPSITVYKGDVQKLNIVYSPSDTTDYISYSSSSSSNLSVDSTGKITAKYTGTYKVTATASSGVKAYCTIKVIDYPVIVTGIELDQEEHDMLVGEVFKLNATVTPSNATNKTITWASTDETVASVSQAGTVEAKGAGKTLITAETENGIIAYCIVNVTGVASTNLSKIYVPDVLATEDNYVDIPVMIENNPGISFASISVLYDADKLEPISVTNGDVFGSVLGSIENSESKVKLCFTSDVDIDDDGILATIRFNVLDKNSEPQVKLCYFPSEIRNTQAVAVAFNLGDGRVSIAECSHKNTELINAKEASCTQNGYTGDIYCLECGEMISTGDIINPTGHSLVTDEAVDATCTKTGKTQGSHCSVCGTVITAQKTIAATGHKYDSGKVTKSATCTTTGVKTYTCTVCGDTKTETIAKKAHTYKTYTTKATTSKNGSIVTKCSVCGAVKSKSTIYYPKTITLSTTSYTYNGSVKKPTVKVVDSNGKTISSSNYTVTYASGRKNVGKYAVKITFKGNYSGTKTLYFTINSKSTTLSSVTAKSKGFTVKWKKQTTQTTGYQIQYSTSSKFTNAKTVTVSKNSTTSKTVSGLSAKKKYYVRVRTYKTVNGTKYYSSWSSAKSVTTKK